VGTDRRAPRVVSSLACRHSWLMRSLRSARHAFPGGRTARTCCQRAPALWASRTASWPEDGSHSGWYRAPGRPIP